MYFLYKYFQIQISVTQFVTILIVMRFTKLTLISYVLLHTFKDYSKNFGIIKL